MPKRPRNIHRSLPYGAGSCLVRAEGKVQARWFDGLRNRAKTFNAHSTEQAHQDCEDFLRVMDRQLRAGTYVEPSRMTVSELVSEYIDRSADRLTERSIRTYRERARSMIDPLIGTHRAVDLSPVDVQRWVQRLTRDGWNPTTIGLGIAVLSGAYKDALRLGMVTVNPVRDVRRPSPKRTEMAVWSAAEARAVLEAVRGDVIYAALYHVALATGMRQGELRALQWADVDLERGQIVVRRTIGLDEHGSEVIVNRTKSGKPRTIIIAPSVVDILRWHRARQAERKLAHPAWDEHGVVFDCGSGRWCYPTTWRRYHKALCARAGVPEIRIHDMRHSAATLLLEAGVHVKVVSEIMGHAHIQITLDTYSHVSESLQRDAAEALERRLFGT